MQHDEKYWSDRYQNQETQWDTGEITTPLKEYIDQLKDKQLKILIPGCGNAYEAEYLIKQGFEHVYVIDLAIEPLNALKDRCPQFPKENLIHGDFFELEEKFDLMMEQTFFCALHPSLRGKYASKAHEILRENGRLVGLLFDDKLNADHPPYGGTQSEYREYFAPYFEFHSFERSYNSIAPRSGRELFINLLKKS